MCLWNTGWSLTCLTWGHCQGHIVIHLDVTWKCLAIVQYTWDTCTKYKRCFWYLSKVTVNQLKMLTYWYTNWPKHNNLIKYKKEDKITYHSTFTNFLSTFIHSKNVKNKNNYIQSAKMEICKISLLNAIHPSHSYYTTDPN